MHKPQQLLILQYICNKPEKEKGCRTLQRKMGKSNKPQLKSALKVATPSLELSPLPSPHSHPADSNGAGSCGDEARGERTKVKTLCNGWNYSYIKFNFSSSCFLTEFQAD